MKKKLIGTVIIFILVPAFLLGSFFCSRTTFWHIDSPDGQYRIFGWLTDVGGWGYIGKFYLKETGLFNEWHLLGTGPSSCEWVSPSMFHVTSPSIDGYSRDYSVNEFIISESE
jgi:hypothetical protein